MITHRKRYGSTECKIQSDTPTRGERATQRAGAIRHLAGDDTRHRAECIIAASMLHRPDIFPAFCERVSGAMFSAAILRRIAGYAFGELSVYGDVDARRVLDRVQLGDDHPDRVRIVGRTLASVAWLITDEILDSAIWFIEQRIGGAAA